jgi:hypothetical protein
VQIRVSAAVNEPRARKLFAMRKDMVRAQIAARGIRDAAILSAFE